MKREIVAPAPDLELQLVIGAKRPKHSCGKHTYPHGHITSTQELKAAECDSAAHGDTASEQQLTLHVDPALVAPDGQSQAESGGVEMSPPAPPQAMVAKDMTRVLASADRVARVISSTAGGASPTAVAGQVPCGASAAGAHAPVSGQEPVLRIQLQKVFTAGLAAHDILLYPARNGGLLGTGNSAIVFKGTAVPAANKTVLSDPAIPQRSASEAALTAGSTSAKGSQDSPAFAVKLFKTEIGTPGTREHEEWNTPHGQAVKRQHIQRELETLQLLRGIKGVVQLCAIGEVAVHTAIPGITMSGAACKAGSGDKCGSSARPQLLQCAVLEKDVPLNQVLPRGHPIPEVHIKKMVSTLAEVLDLLHSGRLCCNGQHYVVVHRDIKLDNLLLSKKGLILSDFGSAALVPIKRSNPVELNNCTRDSGCSSCNSAAMVSLAEAVGTSVTQEVSALTPAMSSDPAEPGSTAHKTRSNSGSKGMAMVSFDTAVGTPVCMALEMALLFKFYAARAAGDSCAVQGLERLVRPYTSSVDMWSLGVVVVLLLGGGVLHMQQHLKVPDGMKQSDHMQDFVKKFVNGQVTLGVMSSSNEQHNAAVREFVDCCCGINRQRMTAAQMMDPATRPIWLPKLR